MDADGPRAKFTTMEKCTAEDWAIIGVNSAPFLAPTAIYCLGPMTGLEPTYLARGLLRWQARGASAAKLPTRHSGRGARVRGIATAEAATPTRCA